MNKLLLKASFLVPLLTLSLAANLSAATTAREIVDRYVGALGGEKALRHVAHWSEETIQQFWSGESWSIPGDSFELSYSLAAIVWRKIEVDLGASRELVLQFVAGAYFDDVGEMSFQTVFKRSLGDLVAELLGGGDWSPNPAKWPSESLAAPDAPESHGSHY